MMAYSFSIQNLDRKRAMETHDNVLVSLCCDEGAERFSYNNVPRSSIFLVEILFQFLGNILIVTVFSLIKLLQFEGR